MRGLEGEGFAPRRSEKYKLQGVQGVLRSKPTRCPTPRLSSLAGLEAETNSFRLLLKTTLFSFIAKLGESRER